ncbi:MAG: inositol monophosphatase [Patescibacteria group bacterium]|nr:inositol monophosphatase [Patescibacteria group bacterium]
MIDVAIEAAKKGGEVLLRYFETELAHEVKDDATFVTKADCESEAAILGILQPRFPDHSFLAEETGESKKDSPYKWIIDPLDGTANFINGLPLWAISIALLKNNEVIGAVVYNPLINFLVHAERGNGLWCNGMHTHVSSQNKDTAMISAGVGKEKGTKEKLSALLREAPKHIKTYRYIGTAALELATLARGGTEGYISLGNSPWDYAAGTLLVQEGGGTITDFHGNPWSFEENYFVASNGTTHHDILELIKSAGM